jgi:energy-coupling factor transporter ATP-binding protein EcfA2
MYDFRTLSPLDFEELARDLLQADLGLRFESFGTGRDLGIDFRFAAISGNAIVQAKHKPDANTAALIRVVREESEKISKLRPKPSRYLLATSAALTPHSKSKLQEVFTAAPLALADIFGREDLNNLLGRHNDLERKHFKLWLTSTAVLERILHSGVYNRTETEMSIIRKMVPKFVSNESVLHADKILSKHGALIITGQPGVGKSTLARILIWLHAEQNWKIFVIDDIKEAFEMANEGEKRLIFFDDFLGQVRLSTDLIRGMDQRFPPFLQRVRSNKDIRFVLTSRDYILHQAQAESSRLGSPDVNAIEFTLDVGTYTRAARAQMLFNHLYFSDISPHEREALLQDDFFLRIIDHPNFNPRLIDLLTAANYISITGSPIRDIVQTVLKNPQELWKIPYRSHMSPEARALMLALFFNEREPNIEALERAFTRMSEVMGMPFGVADIPRRFRAALRELEGSVLAIKDRCVSFANPGVRDFLRGVINEDKFLPLAVEAVTEFSELDHAWSFFHSQKIPMRYFDSMKGELVSQPAQPNMPEDPSSIAWTSAAGRLIRHGSGTPLGRLNLFVAMYDYLQAEELLPILGNAIRQLEDSEIEGVEAELSAEVIDRVDSSLLPLEIRAEAKRAVCCATEKMLCDCSGFSIDELESVVKALVKHSIDEEAMINATDIAIREYIENLRWELDSIESFEELERHQQRVGHFVSNYGPADKELESSMKASFERRYDDLCEKRGPYDDYEGYGPRDNREPGISDQEIRSMFSQLS